MIAARWLTGRKQSDKTRNSDTPETRTSSDCSGQYSYLIHFQIALFTKVVIIICLVTEIIAWKQKLKNQMVRIEISRVQPGKPGNFLPLGSFPFQCSSGQTCKTIKKNSRIPDNVTKYSVQGSKYNCTVVTIIVSSFLNGYKVSK